MKLCLVCGALASDREENNHQLVTAKFFVKILLELGNEFDEFLSINNFLEEWSTCDQCQQSIEESWKVYNELVELAETLRTKREEFVEKLKSCQENSTSDLISPSPSPRRATVTREFKTTHTGPRKLRLKLHEHDWSKHSFKVIPRLPRLEWEELSVKEEVDNDEELKEEVDNDEELKVNESIPVTPVPCVVKQESDFTEKDTSFTSYDNDSDERTYSPVWKRRKIQNGARIRAQNYSEKPRIVPRKQNLHGAGEEVEEREVDVSGRDDLSDKSTRNAKPKKMKTPKTRSRRQASILPDLKKNPSTKKFHCPSCDFATKWNNSIRIHYKLIHLKVPAKKKQRSYIFPNVLLPDLPRNQETNKFSCPSCDQSFSYRESVRRHYKRTHLNEIKKYPCTWPECGRVFATRENWTGHMDKHKGTPRFKCSECPLAFYTLNPLTRHRQRDHEGGREKKPFVCVQCGMTFSTKDYMTTHQGRAHGSRSQSEVVCEECGQSMTAEKLYRHIRNTHGKHKTSGANPNSGVGEVTCHICGKLLRMTNVAFARHMRNVHKDLSVKGLHDCSECHMTFVTKEHLEVHLLAKHKIGDPNRKPKAKRWQCDVRGCRVKFNVENSFKSHMEEIHGPDGKKSGRWACQYCNKRFFLKSHFSHHELGHQNVETRPFICEICGKGYQTPHYLKVHLVKTHKLKETNPLN